MTVTEAHTPFLYRNTFSCLPLGTPKENFMGFELGARLAGMGLPDHAAQPNSFWILKPSNSGNDLIDPKLKASCQMKSGQTGAMDRDAYQRENGLAVAVQTTIA